ncbi:MAG: hypothetical protein IPK72_00015 [Candidatus Eisenbacteria bacterium]|nr:hypothetical protein [Candidatus Eisenbacteria bacterium]
MSDRLGSVLQATRDDLNHRFADVRRANAGLDGQAFLSFVAESIDPLAQAVPAGNAERIRSVVDAAYDIGLELFSKGLVGGQARSRQIEAAWREVATATGGLLAASPRRLLAALTNAVVNLEGEGGRAEEWVARMATIAPRCGDLETLLRVGQVAAWRAGLAHHRSGALAVADGLDEGLVRAALDVRRDRGTNYEWGSTTTPGSIRNGRGFGGLFRQPPQVAAAEEQFLVRSGAEHWLMTVDLYGATFHRATAGEFEQAAQNRAWPRDLELKRGTLVRGGQSLALPVLEQPNSLVASAYTVAATTPHSHTITLVALG